MQKKSDWLLEHAVSVTSEHGEDGIIEKIFEVIGAKSRWCVELGALNGTHGSNTWQLITKKQWSAVLIEADPTYFEQLRATYAPYPRVYCVNNFVTFEGEYALDKIFAQTPLPREFDLLSLDIDGNEYHLWDSLAVYRPRVVVVEFNPSIPNAVSFVQPRDMSIFQGSSLRALTELGERKGYTLVAANAVNAFFVLEELFPLFEIADDSLDAIHTDHSFETQLFQLYDGTLMIAGNDKLIWHNMPIDVEKLQVLSGRKRAYPARIPERAMMRSIKYHVRKLPFYPILKRVRRWLSRIA